MNVLIEECVYFMEDYEILQENVFHDLQDKLFSLSINDIKNKILNYKKKADNKLQKQGFSKKYIDSFTNKIAKDVKNKIKINKISDINKQNTSKFINQLYMKVKNELKNNTDLKNKIGEGKFILSTIFLFIVSVIGTIILIVSISGILLLPFFWFLMMIMYQLLVNKYLEDLL